MIVFALCFTLFFSAGALLFVNPVSADTENVSSVVMEEGAAVRVLEPSGIRFTAKISAEDYDEVLRQDENAAFGMLLIPKDILGEDELTLDTALALNIPAEKWAEVTETERMFTGVLVGKELENGGYENFSAAEYLRQLTARAYVTANGVTQYAANPQTSSIAEVASKAVKQGITDELLLAICDTVVGDGLSFAESKTTLAVNAEPFVPTLNGTQGLAVAWSSSDKSVFTVDDNGLVTPVAAGTAVLTAKIGNKTAQTQLVVIGAPQNVRFDEVSKTVVWNAVEGAEKYLVSVDGAAEEEVGDVSYPFADMYGDFEVTVSAVCGGVKVSAEPQNISVARFNVRGETGVSTVLADFEAAAYENWIDENGNALTIENGVLTATMAKTWEGGAFTLTFPQPIDVEENPILLIRGREYANLLTYLVDENNNSYYLNTVSAIENAVLGKVWANSSRSSNVKASASFDSTVYLAIDLTNVTADGEIVSFAKLKAIKFATNAANVTFMIDDIRAIQSDFEQYASTADNIVEIDFINDGLGFYNAGSNTTGSNAAIPSATKEGVSVTYQGTWKNCRAQVNLPFTLDLTKIETLTLRVKPNVPDTANNAPGIAINFANISTDNSQLTDDTVAYTATKQGADGWWYVTWNVREARLATDKAGMTDSTDVMGIYVRKLLGNATIVWSGFSYTLIDSANV